MSTTYKNSEECLGSVTTLFSYTKKKEKKKKIKCSFKRNRIKNQLIKKGKGVT
ncbi:unnamed protein product [Brassica oleracea]|uniref:(rape) hypothetical protein n=1 Tax=Brassica napus TaxID=3708 RepID=A0A816IA98_BRANA|nr:unnamed protein product [Brassica napus]